MLLILLVIVLLPPRPPSIVYVASPYAPLYPVSPLSAADFDRPILLFGGVTDARKPDERAGALQEYQVAQVGKQHYCLEGKEGRKVTVARHLQEAFAAEMSRLEFQVIRPDAAMPEDRKARDREAAARHRVQYVLDVQLSKLRVEASEEGGVLVLHREIALTSGFFDVRTGTPAWQGTVSVSMPGRLLFPANDEQVRELMTDVLQEAIVQTLMRFRDARRSGKAG